MGTVVAFKSPVWSANDIKAQRPVWSVNDIKSPVQTFPTNISGSRTRRLDKRVNTVRKTLIESGLSLEYISEKSNLCVSTVKNLLEGNTKSPHCRSVLQLMDFCSKERVCGFEFHIVVKPSFKVAKRA